MNVSEARFLLNGTHGLFDPLNVGNFFEAAISHLQNWTFVEQQWGISLDQLYGNAIGNFFFF